MRSTDWLTGEIRPTAASNAVKTSTLTAFLASPFAISGMIWLSNKTGVSMEVLSYAAGALGALFQGYVAYRSKGGRAGESH